MQKDTDTLFLIFIKCKLSSSGVARRMGARTPGRRRWGHINILFASFNTCF